MVEPTMAQHNRDEIEKGLATGGSASDGGVGARVLGTILTWQQEQKNGVFIIATANDVTSLPPEFLRAGRFDSMFFVDIPTESERASIFKAIITRYKRDPNQFDLDLLARKTQDFTGAEIEAAFVEAMIAAYGRNKQDPSNKDVLTCAKQIVPLSTTMGEKLTALREWAKSRARSASSISSEDAAPSGLNLDLDAE